MQRPLKILHRYEYIKPRKLDKRILAYEIDRSFRLGKRINIKAQEKEMIKQIGDKMDYRQWSDAYEMKYNVMPAWWWNNYMREKAYKNYLEGKAYD